MDNCALGLRISNFMTKKNWLLIFALVALAGIYGFYFTDWFKPKIIHISSASRANRQRVRNNNATEAAIPVAFSLAPECKLTEITVVPLLAWETNKNVLPVWHLIANTNAEAIKIFTYGQRLRGLKPALPGSHAEPLQPDVTYRLFVTAGSAKGQHDFEAKSIN
jgi:hypothetical protein